ncbi:MAG: hypothetical protein ACOYNN_15085 [Terrimicrobiaceae bacterium]
MMNLNIDIYISIVMFSIDDIITGEKIQELCDAYCGLQSDFEFNRRIFYQSSKHINLDQIDRPWDNPKIIFCYGHRLTLLMSKLPFIQNKFILVSHNSDENITDQYRELADSPLIKKWYAQNVLIDHPKIEMIPIGVANSMWGHGRLDIYPVLNIVNKPNDFYFNFTVDTNRVARSLCRSQVEQKGLQFMNNTLPIESYLHTLCTYKYAICPPGNGVDSHRIWECYYCNVIPIVINNKWTQILKKYMPCIVLDNWNELDLDALIKQYNELAKELVNNQHTVKFSYLKSTLLSSVMMI